MRVSRRFAAKNRRRRIAACTGWRPSRRQGRWAFLEVLVLWALIILTIVLFWRVRKAAALLLVPYLLWVSFAAALTFSVWQRNPGLLR